MNRETSIPWPIAFTFGDRNGNDRSSTVRTDARQAGREPEQTRVARMREPSQQRTARAKQGAARTA